MRPTCHSRLNPHDAIISAYAVTVSDPAAAAADPRIHLLSLARQGLSCFVCCVLPRLRWHFWGHPDILLASRTAITQLEPQLRLRCFPSHAAQDRFDRQQWAGRLQLFRVNWWHYHDRHDVPVSCCASSSNRNPVLLLKVLQLHMEQSCLSQRINTTCRSALTLFLGRCCISPPMYICVCMYISKGNQNHPLGCLCVSVILQRNSVQRNLFAQCSCTLCLIVRACWQVAIKTGQKRRLGQLELLPVKHRKKFDLASGCDACRV